MLPGCARPQPSWGDKENVRFLQAVYDFLSSGAVNTVPTITLLRAIQVGNSVDAKLVSGFATPGDGGGGLFLWIPGASAGDNIGVVIDSNYTSSGRWVRYGAESTYNVKWFGAKGDGATNDSPAFLSAASAIPATGGAVYVPSAPLGYAIGPGPANPPFTGNTGVYLLRDNLRIFGDGPGSYIFSKQPTANMFWIDGDSNKVESLHFDSRLPVNPSGAMLVMGGDKCEVNNNFFENSLTVDKITPRTSGAFAGNNLTNFRFLNNTTHQCQVAPCGLGRSVEGLLIQGNKFIEPHENGISLVGGSFSPTHMLDVEIVDNYIENPSATGIYIGWDAQGNSDFDVSRFIVSRNIIRGQWSLGGIFIRRGTNTCDLDISGNLIDGDFDGALPANFGLNGIYVYEGFNADYAASWKIHGNQIRNVHGSAIKIRAIPETGMSIRSNHVRGIPATYGATAGIGLGEVGHDPACRDLDISENTIIDPRNYGIELSVGAGSIVGTINHNTIRNVGFSGISYGIGLISTTGTVDLRMSANVIGYDYLPQNMDYAIVWTGMGTIPAMTIMDCDFRPFTLLNRFNPPADPSWNIRDFP